MNQLYYADNLEGLREHIDDESVASLEEAVDEQGVNANSALRPSLVGGRPLERQHEPLGRRKAEAFTWTASRS